MFTLLDHLVDDRGSCVASYKEIGERFHLSARRVRAGLEELDRREFIKIEEQPILKRGQRVITFLSHWRPNPPGSTIGAGKQNT
jgi:hypothetical protein